LIYALFIAAVAGWQVYTVTDQGEPVLVWVPPEVLPLVATVVAVWFLWRQESWWHN
jgi:hypothetical protein